MSEQLLTDINNYIDVHQRELAATVYNGAITVSGKFWVKVQCDPLEAYDVHIVLPDGFPLKEPIVFETAGKIPRTQERHMNDADGHCCLTVWEAWLCSYRHPTFEQFMNGPVADFFLGQSIVARGGDWPFAELAHGKPGILDAFATALATGADHVEIVKHLRLLAMKKIKGHHSCPCGSGVALRNCHAEKMRKLSDAIDPTLAAAMLTRIRS
ncbi:hypothetical protein [Henriciella marina]|uniref:SEC-C domain-containing protein n=1 Tax=Henriciella marina TaxID=453851 RepID=A0ABT4LT05_9PROT|nr:hypothetical protein [Henriciella marina]MCZ4297505.1 hypothetical protein [Henriciella marina]